MKKRLIVLFCIILICLPSCEKTITDEYPKDIPIEIESENYNIINIQADWPYYRTSEDIIKAATNIYIGKVTNISFEILDMKTGQIDRSKESTSTTRMLYTVYTISVRDSIKGDNPKEIKICYTGGLSNYHTAEQYNLLSQSSLLTKYNGIPIINSDCSLAIDKEYLFCTLRTTTEFDFILNPTQFAHHIDSENAKMIIQSCNK